jgi:hypothetical protein
MSTGSIASGVKVAGAWGLTTLPPSFAGCLEIWETFLEPPGPVMDLYRYCFNFDVQSKFVCASENLIFVYLYYICYILYLLCIWMVPYI